MRDTQCRLFLWIAVGVAALGILIQAAILTFGELRLHYCPEPHWHLCNDEELKERISAYVNCIETTIHASIDTKLAFLAGDSNITLMNLAWSIGQVYLC